MNLNRLIGDNIWMTRELTGMTQAEVARRIGLSRVSIVNIEAGRQMATTDTLFKLSILFGCSVNDFFPEKGEYKPKLKW